MYFRSCFDSKLAQFSYIVGCQRTGEAIVIDPARDISQYHEIAKAEGLRITAATETHIHADFVSGARQLAQHDVQLYLSDEGGNDWTYQYEMPQKIVLLKDGDTFYVGNIRFDVLHTPGHTPEHISFVVTDEGGGSSVPMGIFTGDFVFVGDVGRPDLLEKAAGVQGTAESGAHSMYQSLSRFRELPDYLQVWPGHGAGSACGKSLGAVPMTTVGYEKINNWALKIDNEDQFVQELLSGQPEPPTYFAVMKRVNKRGPELVDETEQIPKLTHGGQDHVIIDTRSAKAYQAGFKKGTLNLPYNKSFANWSGWLLPYDQDLVLIAYEDQIEDILKTLHSIGVDRIAGYLDAEKVSFTEQYPEIDAMTLQEHLNKNDVYLIDVRNQSEWDAGHIEGAHHIMLGTLEDQLEQVPKDKKIVMQCQSGARSSIATSLMKRAGFEQVYNLNGGYQGWKKADKPVVQS
ncbi:MBL fold metallo-hydrolase [Exiguobacterium artemiae]|uniref:MBL fold metallo-hydrolase n=1 Tax=Exiguobacterium artemiae TaxID=340145 RepID=UPI00296570CA|nr:MBL fold metallo-hydrolase [Exiguobacterium sibiricum]MDW2884680.1 MBL fold metallo-hydrolase [Exiguobacterium sibiricum]